MEDEERRRAKVELNLISEAKERSKVASRGCASLIGRLLGGALLLVTLALGLSHKI
jgi:hypothetical protein